MYHCVAMILISSTWIKTGENSEVLTYTLFLVQIFWIGSAINVLFIFLDARTDPKIYGTSLELNLCFA